MNRARLTMVIASLVLLLPQPIMGQNDLAAILEVLETGVEVQRVNTSNWIEVQLEAIVGVGDRIRTSSSGRARITFFADGVDTDLLANTTYRIDQFSGQPDSFQISVSVLAGQTLQRLRQLLDVSSSYDINTPGMDLVARGTEFAIRVEDTGRSAMLVAEGIVEAGADETSAAVDPGFGIRSEAGNALSDVVRATTFDELDAALDGCSITIAIEDDIRINVRLGPSRDFARIGTVDPSEVSTLIGQTESAEWYRLAYRGGFGWILPPEIAVDESCAGFRLFPDTHGPEDTSLFSSLGDEVDIADIEAATATEPAADAS